MDSHALIIDQYLNSIDGLATSPKLELSMLALASALADKPSLSFIENLNFLRSIESNPNIEAVFCTAELAKDVEAIGRRAYVVDNPKFHYFTLYNAIAMERISIREPSEISRNSRIHKSASISQNDVFIGENVIVEAGVVITERVRIGAGSIIRSNSVIGAPGFEHKKYGNKVLTVVHDGFVKIGEDVEIGASSVIGQGFFGKNTEIGNDSKLDNLVSIAHGSSLGMRVLIGAGTVVSGSVEVGDDVYIGPGSTITNGITLGSNSTVVLGSVVLRNVEPRTKVMGSPAREFPKL